MDRVDNPADARITTDSLVLGVNEDDFEVLVGRILVDPVGVEDTKIGATTTDSFFGGGAEGTLVLELVHTLVRGFAWRVTVSLLMFEVCIWPSHTECSTLGHRLLATTASNTDSVDDIALLGLVSETTSLVWSGRTGSAVNDVQLSELY